MLKYLVGALCGAAIAAAAIVSCADSHVAPVDAATSCDCPAAEPPLAGRLVTVTKTKQIAGNGSDRIGVACPQGATTISGGCSTKDENGSLQVTSSNFNYGSGVLPSWICDWHNTDPNPQVGIATALCLVPPGASDAGP